jgi:D-alanyl-lipoteichoic acid acyltransferase DltB (MBOAT superfamily)
VNNILHQLVYNPEDSLVFTSGFFLLFFLILAAFYPPTSGSKALRNAYLVAFSLYFYYKTSGLYVVLLIGVAILGFLLCRLIAASEKKLHRRTWLFGGIAIYLAVLIHYKYTNFVLASIGTIFAHNLPLSEIIMPLGISFFTFQSIGCLIDVYRRTVKPAENFVDYALFVTFFPQIIAGPIARSKDLFPQIQAASLIDREMIGRGLFLILCGIVKKMVIADYLSANFVDRVFDNPLLYSGLENLVGLYGYAIQIYCDFSGYSDIAIGLALLLGFRLQQNFNAPYRSASVTEFWRRWHISLSTWFRDYLFLPLANTLGRRFKAERAFGIKSDLWVYGISAFVTFSLCGLWHGPAWKYVLWGSWHGLGIIADKVFHLPRFFGKSPFRKFLGGCLTFHFVLLGWLFFRATSVQAALDSIGQIVTSFHPGLFGQYLAGYPIVSALLVGGYVLHFLPGAYSTKLESDIIRLPLLAQSLVLALVVLLAFQVHTAAIQPFIYFTF